MDVTTRHKIAFADEDTPQEIDVITGTMAASIDGAFDTAHFRSAANYAALPANDGTYIAGRTRAYTTSDRRDWIWTGTRFVLVGGAVPRAQVKPTADVSLGTSYAGFVTTNDGIATSGNFVVPAGCDGIYDFSFIGRSGTPAANVMIRPFVNNVAAGPIDFISGDEQQIVAIGDIALAAAAVLQFRVRVFAGSASLSAASTVLRLAFRSAT